YDEQGVYFLVKAGEPDVGKLRKDVPQVLDAAVWGNDDVEIFVDPLGDRNEYAQFAVNPAGVRSEFYFIESGNTGRAMYNPKWDAAATIGKDGYVVEVFIPYAALYCRKLKEGPQDWVFSVARQRLAGSEFMYTAFSHPPSDKGFHDIKSWGHLKGVTVPADRYVYTAGKAPTVSMTKDASGAYQAFVAAEIRNLSNKMGEVVLGCTVEGKLLDRRLTIPANAAASAELGPYTVKTFGKKEVWVNCHGAATNDLLFANLYVARFNYEPLKITVTEPAYRNAIYFTENIKAIQAEIGLNMPEAKLAGATLETKFLAADEQVLFSKQDALSAGLRRIAVSIPADKLGEGEYRLAAALKDKAGAVIEETTAPIRKLGKAPGVEARVGKDGKVIIEGVPVLIRGMAVGFGYLVPAGALPAIRCPRAMNFAPAIDNVGADRNCYYYFTTLDRMPGLEAAAKQDARLPEETKKRVLEVIRENRFARNLIGYYLSDEPECRSLSPDTLKELYQFVKENDPWRFCIIVSRSPATYVDCCDVICPHPYVGPLMDVEGRRTTGRDAAYVHMIMTEAIEGIAGRAKALWIMPQIFSYYNLSPTMFPDCVMPDFDQARWAILGGIANKATGMTPFAFYDYWNEIETRVGVTYLFELLAWLDSPLMDGKDVPLAVACSEGAVDAIGKAAPDGELYVVAANRSDVTLTATFKSEAFKSRKRMNVVGENRSVAIRDGAFEDRFVLNGAHVYTTLEALPYMKSVDEVKAELAALRTNYDKGNLLRNGSTDWAVGIDGRNARLYGDQLADGCVDTGGWFPAYTSRTEFDLVFPKGVKFHKFVFYSYNIESATLQVWDSGKWTDLKTWNDMQGFKQTWEGDRKETVKMRLRVNRLKPREQMPSVTEVELY
ncbi:MAG: hypothetical protein PHR35_04885, partial [Kiritimatiellae bacterium]|nr:hypothetical protein [Kiritimatiellia bacterium]